MTAITQRGKSIGSSIEPISSDFQWGSTTLKLPARSAAGNCEGLTEQRHAVRAVWLLWLVVG
jgi:hypothetical protein